MNHRSVIRLSAALLAAVSLGCSNKDPMSTAPETIFSVNPVYTGVDVGGTKQLTATLGGAPVAATWESSNPAVATVSATGLVTTVTDGFTAVTAKLVADPSRIFSSNITVNKVFGTPLTNGVGRPVSSSLARNTTVLYRIFVPEGKTNLRVTISGGTGDVDMYIRRGTPPTTASGQSSCRSENDGNEELCSIANPAEGSWYILLVVYDPYDGATLKATYTP